MFNGLLLKWFARRPLLEFESSDLDQPCRCSFSPPFFFSFGSRDLVGSLQKRIKACLLDYGAKVGREVLL